MFQWHVELTSRDEVLLAFLSTCLQEPSCTVIQNNSERYYIREKEGEPVYLPSDFPSESTNDRYYWLSSDFDLCTNPQDVLSYAKQQLPLLNSIIKLKYGARISSIKIDDVYRADEQGRLIKETVTFPPITGRLVTSESSLQAANAQHPIITELWLAARNDPKVDEEMRHYANQTNWFNLYKAYEVIENDVGKDTINSWAKSRSEDFTYSANNAQVSGYNARHFSEKFPKLSPKRKSMSLHEATQFINDILLQWLQTKI